MSLAHHAAAKNIPHISAVEHMVRESTAAGIHICEACQCHQAQVEEVPDINNVPRQNILTNENILLEEIGNPLDSAEVALAEIMTTLADSPVDIEYPDDPATLQEALDSVGIRQATPPMSILIYFILCVHYHFYDLSFLLHCKHFPYLSVYLYRACCSLITSVSCLTH